jgi:hypothetical protein
MTPRAQQVGKLNNRVRLITRCCFGFHSANAVVVLLALLPSGPITLTLPHPR